MAISTLISFPILQRTKKSIEACICSLFFFYNHRCWDKADTNGNGELENDEVVGFLNDFTGAFHRYISLVM